MRVPGGGTGAANREPRQMRRRGELLDRVEIEMVLGHVGEMFEPRGEVAMLGGLHQAEMALGQRERSVARDRAENRNVERGDRLRHEPHMPLAADAVQHDPADPHLADRARRSRAPKPPPIAIARRRR